MLKKLFVILCGVLFLTDSFATTDIAANAESSTCDSGVLGTTEGDVNFDAKWAANEVPLRWYNEDNLLNVQDAANVCTYDGILTLPSSAPQRIGYTFAGWKIKTILVPEGYTQLQYIQSSGTQYIDTGIGINSGSIVNATVQGMGDRGIIFGFDQDYVYSYIGDRTGMYYAGGAKTYIADTEKINVEITWTGEPGTGVTQITKINGQTFSGGGRHRGYGDMYLFRGREWDSTDSYWIGKIYNFSIMRNGVFLINLVPAKNSSGVVGMWDTVSKTFFTNSGSGTFSEGPVVQ